MKSNIRATLPCPLCDFILSDNFNGRVFGDYCGAIYVRTGVEFQEELRWCFELNLTVKNCHFLS